MAHIVDQHAIVYGNRITFGVHGNGVPVVLLHGTPSSSYIWRNVVPRLVERGYKVHVYDLLGYGLSERPWKADVDTSMTGQVEVLEQLLRLWDVETFHLVAHDIGGGIAQRFGVKATDRLRSLTMIDVVSYDSYPSKRTQQQMSEGLERLTKMPDLEHRAHFRDWLLSTHSDAANFDSEALGIYLDFISGPIGQGSLFQHQVAHYDPKHTMEIADELGVLAKVPVRLIWGANDTWQVVDWAHRLNRAIPGSELHIVENCGHFAPEERPREVATLLLDFLGRAASNWSAS